MALVVVHGHYDFVEEAVLAVTLEVVARVANIEHLVEKGDVAEDAVAHIDLQEGPGIEHPHDRLEATHQREAMLLEIDDVLHVVVLVADLGELDASRQLVEISFEENALVHVVGLDLRHPLYFDFVVSVIQLYLTQHGIYFQKCRQQHCIFEQEVRVSHLSHYGRPC